MELDDGREGMDWLVFSEWIRLGACSECECVSVPVRERESAACEASTEANQSPWAKQRLDQIVGSGGGELATERRKLRADDGDSH